MLAANMREALSSAGLTPNHIDYVNAHGTGTLLNDQMELAAMEAIALERDGILPSSSTKATTGHCLGATAAIEAVVCLKSLADQTIPFTANLTNAEPTTRVELVASISKKTELQNVMTTSLGFWGNQASLIFGKYGN